MNVTEYFGLQWQPDFTCWDMVRLIFKNEHLIELPPYHVVVGDAVCLKMASDVIDAATTPPSDWEEICLKDLQQGDIVIFGGSRIRHHVGYCVSHDHMIIHLPENASARVEPLARLAKPNRTITAYRHATLRNHN